MENSINSPGKQGAPSEETTKKWPLIFFANRWWMAKNGQCMEIYRLFRDIGEDPDFLPQEVIQTINKIAYHEVEDTLPPPLERMMELPAWLLGDTSHILNWLARRRTTLEKECPLRNPPTLLGVAASILMNSGLDMFRSDSEKIELLTKMTEQLAKDHYKGLTFRKETRPKYTEKWEELLKSWYDEMYKNQMLWVEAVLAGITGKPKSENPTE